MKLTFLGVHAALVARQNQFQSNMILQSDSGSKLLIDCGTDIRHSLLAQGFSHRDIDAIYVSHLHSDHVGGLEWMGFSKYFIDKQRPALFLPPDLSKSLWDNVLSGGMTTLAEEKASLSTFFDVNIIQDNRFEWEGYVFHTVKTHHAISNHTYLPSYGLMIDSKNEKIFITTDASFTPDLFHQYYLDATVIFQDCETSNEATGLHARYQDLVHLDRSIKQKMWLYDYNEGILPQAEQDGFKGFVQTGQTFGF